MKKTKTTQSSKKFSHFYKIWVRLSIIKEFTYGGKFFDDMLAGLHEIRARNYDKRKLNYEKSMP